MQTENSMVKEGYNLGLNMECRNLNDVLENECYQLILYLKDSHGIFFEYDRSDNKQLLQGAFTMRFTKSIQCQFSFEKKQPIKVELICFESKMLVGQCQTTLGQVVGSKGSQMLFAMHDLLGKKKGNLLIKAEKQKKQNQFILMDIQVNNLENQSWLGWSKTTSYLTITYINNGIKRDIYKSSNQVNTQDPLFAGIKLTFELLCHSDPFQELIGSVYDYNGGKQAKLIGDFKFSVYQVNDQKQRKFALMIGDKKSGEVTFARFQFDPTFQFYQYIRSGMELALIIAVDMTESNKPPHLKESLHSIHPESKNQYLDAIRSVSEVLLNYDHDKLVPLFGFGGKPQLPNLTTEDVLHCFPLNGNPYDPHVDGLDGIVSTYLNAVKNVQLDGPTFFHQIIEQTMKVAQEEQADKGSQYFILLILTDGIYHDRSATKRQIVKASHLPMSIIIVGIGDEDFSDMIELDGDNGLSDEEGNHAQRDLVQFVPFKDYHNNGEELAQAVLEELPQQVIEYMELVSESFTQRSRQNTENSKKKQVIS